TTWHTAEDFGIRFVQPDSFLIGRFQPLAVSPQAAGLGLKPGLANAVVLVRPEDLGEHSVGAIPVGEIPVIWLDRTLSWNPVAWEQVADTSYAVGERTVYEFPGYPSMYGDASFFYVVSLDPGEWIEIAGHRTAMASGGGVETHFDRVIEELVTTVERVER
ncbi:MAG TPA: hypothetical protein VGC99_17870, partial [Candidatus Tectomicrobia bacterium]